MERGDLIDGSYFVERCIARSAAHEVYQAVDIRDSAARIVRVHRSLSSSGITRFESSCAVLAAHPHPALERLLGWGALPGNARYAVIEVPNGPSLAELLPEADASDVVRTRLPAHDVFRLSSRLLQALGHLHALGIAHGGLSASAVLVPLGFAAATALVDVELVPAAMVASESSMPALALETASCIAPERIRSQEAPTPAGDMFALGCTLYRVVTGRRAFASRSVVGTSLRILYEDPDRLGPIDEALPSEIVALTIAMLSKDPSERPTPREALARLEAPPSGGILGDEAGTIRSRIREVGVIVSRSPVSFASTLAGEAELDSVQRIVDQHGARLDRLSDGTLVFEVEPRSSGGEDALVRTGRVALLLQSLLPLARFVVTRGGSGARGLEAADALLSRIRTGTIAVTPDVAGRLSRSFEIESTGEVSLLYEREQRTRERSRTSERGSSRLFADMDSEITIIEQKRPTLEVEVVQAPPLEQQPTLEMDMSALALSTLPSERTPHPAMADEDSSMISHDEITLNIVPDATGGGDSR